MHIGDFKQSWLITAMNKTTYSIFLLQFVLVTLISVMSVLWQNSTGIE